MIIFSLKWVRFRNGVKLFFFQMEGLEGHHDFQQTYRTQRFGANVNIYTHSKIFVHHGGPIYIYTVDVRFSGMELFRMQRFCSHGFRRLPAPIIFDSNFILVDDSSKLTVLNIRDALYSVHCMHKHIAKTRIKRTHLVSHETIQRSQTKLHRQIFTIGELVWEAKRKKLFVWKRKHTRDFP